MIYPEIFKTVEEVRTTSGCVTMDDIGAMIHVQVDAVDNTIQLSIKDQWFSRLDLTELSAILIRIASTLPPKKDKE
jgi:hypothetical protein